MKKSKYSVVLLAFFQLVLLVFVLAQYLLQHPVQPAQTSKHLLILGSFAGSIVLNVFIVARMVKVYEKEALLSAREAMSQSFVSLAGSIKVQNQDFNLYIEEISSLIHQERWEDLSSYLENICAKITFLNNVLKVDNAIIGALLKAKVSEADVKRIRLDIDISASLAGLDARAVDLARIIGNLVDNAFDAVLPLEESERIVSVKIHRSGPLLEVEVSNRGPAIDPGTLEKIFEPGYTTKREGHSGLGLHIVKTLAEKLMGTVRVFTDETNGTRFVVILPGA
ncbi:signal transduction histidine kinase regulating citrate/malate metabolism [Desulfofundulus kuznetsovii DSM 6115]|uniref:histidine kinase n=1 Tax=Desulfofundulus kuznetsovii (strain DSM 6115 / VKM B-1805 / 17) TaxID=760568 RepID=A0AAU8PJT0_DESK7|nr:signal transduction histidine kinase regulating citrate/malate metabolism [Desulfofundulus kuznetsovii DSM 6115]